MSLHSSKHFDPQLGVDIHTYVTPPAPFPTPHISMVFDFFDYIPFIGATTTIHGLMRSVAGTEGKVIHIPVSGVWAPPYEAPMGPQNEDELFMGSHTVRVDGDPLSRLTMPSLSCNMVGMIPPFRKSKSTEPVPGSLTLPLTVDLALPNTVYVGGPPTVSVMAMVMKFGLAMFSKIGKAEWFKKFMDKFKEFRQNLFKNMDDGFLKCKILRAEPVDIRDGSVRLEQLDFTLPGRLPLNWMRYYSSADINEEGVCGYGWKTPADALLTYHNKEEYWQIELPDGPIYFADSPKEAGREHATYGFPEGRLWFEEEQVNRFTKRHWFVETTGGVIWRFTDPAGNLLPANSLSIAAIEDRNSNKWQFEYKKGQLNKIVESSLVGTTGREIHVTGEDNRIWQMRLYDVEQNSYSDLTGYGYNKDNQLLAQIDNLGKPRVYGWQDRYYMAYHEDRLGQKFYYEYDKQWRVIHAWGDGGLYNYHFNWLDEFNELEVVNSLGHTSIIRFGEEGLPLCEIDPEGGATFFGYDELGRTVEITSPKGNKTCWEYDQFGNICKEVYADDTSIQIDYQDNLPVKITDQDGQIWQYAFDNKGNLLTTTAPIEVTTQYQYDLLGQLTQVKQPNGATYQFIYDSLGLINERIEPTGQKTSYASDIRGNLLKKTNPLQQSIIYQYDVKDRLVQVIKSDSNTINIAYDAEDQPIKYMDEAGQITKLTYNGTGEVTGVQTSDEQWINYIYDTEDQLIAVQNQLKQQWQLKRNRLGGIVEEVDYWGQSTHYCYDSDNNVIAKTDPLGTILNYHYDKLGQLIEKYCKTELLAKYNYDARGLMIQCDNPWRKLAWSYDNLGRVTQELQDGFIINHYYNELGQYAGRSSDTGNTVTLSYNPADQLSHLQLNQEVPIQFEYDELGRIKQEQLTKSLTREINYNSQGQVTAQSILKGTQSLFNSHYHYDKVGNLLERSDNLWGLDQYQYDSTGKLMEHIDPLGYIKKFIFDMAGNRIQDRIQQGSNSEEWLRVGRLDNYNYIYNKAGQLKQRYNKETNTEEYFKWNENQQLTAVHKGQQHTSYAYDGLGRRVYKQTEQSIHWYFWDGDIFLAEAEQSFKEELENTITYPQPITKMGSGNKRQEQLKELFSQLREYIYYPNTFWPLALLEKKEKQETATSYYYHCDINGAPTRLTDNVGRIVWSEQTGIWGEKGIIHANKISNPLRFQGQYYDQETDLHYNRFRYYDPYSNSYISIDPIGLRGGGNVYQYAPNTLTWIDPLGLIKVFRNIRSDESASAGLSAKIPGRDMTAAGHVRNGSKDTFKGSQFISTTVNKDVAIANREPGQVTVTFDTDNAIPDAVGNRSITDLSTSEKATAAGLKGPAHNYAVSSEEVLVEGRVPASAITTCKL